MKMPGIRFAVLSLWALNAYGGTIVDTYLGTASFFAVLAGSTVTNTGVTTVAGDLGVWPGTAVTGFPPGVVSGGSIYSGDAVARQAQTDLTAAYGLAAGTACGTDLTGEDLGGMTLTPGVYCLSSSAQLTGILTLDALGDPNAIFLLKIGSTLTTASSSSVVLTNGGSGNHLYFQVGSSATLGTGTAFAGNLLALTNITLNTGATIECGRALASNGAVTLDNNSVSINSGACGTSAGGSLSDVPEPGTSTLLGSGLILAVVLQRRRTQRKHKVLESLGQQRQLGDQARRESGWCLFEPQPDAVATPGAN